nr:MAG TPA: hypothetical protein [Caudoviricetes sp.]DAV55979.1 MAG TPA: hypothetical protein [Caudoviricetes sp.]
MQIYSVNDLFRPLHEKRAVSPGAIRSVREYPRARARTA